MEGQFLVRQIYDDEITYGLIGAAVEILSKSLSASFLSRTLYFIASSTNSSIMNIESLK
jgi:hypothetical protein